MNREPIEDRWEQLSNKMRGSWERWTARKRTGRGGSGRLGERSGGAAHRVARHAAPVSLRTIPTRRSTVIPILKGLPILGLGAGLMFYLDPDRGRRRRALVRDRLVHIRHRLDDALGTTTRDLTNRSRGLWAGARSLPARLDGRPVEDEVLVARVRAKLGRYVSHPHAIEVTAHHGHVTLQGTLLAHEVDNLLSAVFSVPDVCDLTYHLDAHEQADDVSALQGGRTKTGELPEFCQAHWSPTARLAAGAIGGLLVAAGVRRRGLTGLVLGALGTGLCMRGLTSYRMRRGTDPFDLPTTWRGSTIATGAPILDVAFPFRSSASQIPEVGL